MAEQDRAAWNRVHMAVVRDGLWSPACSDEIGWVAPLADPCPRWADHVQDLPPPRYGAERGRVSSVADAWDDQIEQWRDRIVADLDRPHDDLCEQELVGGPLVYSPCGCDQRAGEQRG